MELLWVAVIYNSPNDPDRNPWRATCDCFNAVESPLRDSRRQPVKVQVTVYHLYWSSRSSCCSAKLTRRGVRRESSLTAIGVRWSLRPARWSMTTRGSSPVCLLSPLPVSPAGTFCWLSGERPLIARWACLRRRSQRSMVSGFPVPGFPGLGFGVAGLRCGFPCPRFPRFGICPFGIIYDAGKIKVLSTGAPKESGFDGASLGRSNL